MTVRDRETEAPSSGRDRSLLACVWYQMVRYGATTFLAAGGGIRASGVENLPQDGAALLVSNHVSHLDVFALGLPLHRPLNYVARSTLFFPPLGILIHSVGGFPIQREGMGASGLKETLRRLRSGGIVVLFPEGTRSTTGELGSLKPGIAALAAKARVPIVPAAVAGSFEAWPKGRALPRAHPIGVNYGPTIQPADYAGASPDAITELIRTRILECQHRARRNVGLLEAPSA